MTSPALSLFCEHLPRKPYHTNELLHGVRIGAASRAMLARYIQHNQPHAMYWLVFDVDRLGAAIDWSDVNAPTPNLTVKNPANGHAHLLYALDTAVRTAPDNSSLKALRYAAAIERGLRDKLRADLGYSSLLCKNPLHDYWGVTEWRSEPYTLDELADYVDLSASDPRREAQAYGLGRNCQLFEKTRTWSYRAIRQGWPEYDQWLSAVIQRVEAYNAQLTVPLSLAECKAIGKSIAKWTHQRITEQGFAQYVADTHTPEIQAARGGRNTHESQAAKGRKSKRGAVEDSARSLKPWEALGISRRWYYQKKKRGLL
ncbi:replication initiation protein [Edwardsiella ictaluri]|uniref:Rep n=1 Tax=Edwardsiella ictaluri TaxID=67780 RepID=Q9KI24_EDWIC|nr:replication initiation protein [Edwardsiella ictaluri]AAF85961.1 putative Rep protein [Edwardsiella ictaluri]AGF34187.1 Rep [Edwardsiella ictaluri]AYD68291.1 putative Rep protein [Edwardsiella ictaluri]EKS7764819.1 replication initiation protein [Edwardsiella ictaluri]EKS7771726.1 replication initiation protein [Edwardsiella ictaluri]